MFDIFKTLKLDTLGEDWKDCYIKFHALTIGEVEEISKLTAGEPTEATRLFIEILERKFVDGKAIQNGKIVDLKKEDIKNLPVEILQDAITLFTESLSKKKLNPSTIASEE